MTRFAAAAALSLALTAPAFACGGHAETRAPETAAGFDLQDWIELGKGFEDADPQSAEDALALTSDLTEWALGLASGLSVMVGGDQGQVAALDQAMHAVDLAFDLLGGWVAFAESMDDLGAEPVATAPKAGPKAPTAGKKGAKRRARARRG